MIVKRVGYIFEKIISKENIENAIICASVKKRKYTQVRKILAHKDKYITRIQQMLLTESFVPNKYREATIIDGSSKKVRKIYKPKFYPDQIIHWCLMLQLEPVFKRGMYDNNFASIKYRGIHKAKNYIRRHIQDKEITHCLKLDIRQFYPSINNVLLKQKFRKIIKDQKVLVLLDKIVDSHSLGIPIGNYTSQWFGNFFLQDLDHYIKETLGVKYYARYMDDMVLLDKKISYERCFLKS